MYPPSLLLHVVYPHAMPYLVLDFVLLLASLGQFLGPAPLRIGDVAGRLSDSDMEALRQALPTGEQPWLLIGEAAQNANSEFIRVYMRPTTSTSLLRRGREIDARREIAPRSAWTIEPGQSYVQVAIPGRSFDDVQLEQDINRPFSVVGSFDDAELIRLVLFLRTNPTTDAPGLSSRVETWPILGVIREADQSVRVMLRGGLWSGQLIRLREAGQDWVIVSIGMWIA